MAKPKRRYLLEPDVPDSRDNHYAFSLTPEHHARKLPPKVDLRPLCPAAFDQGNSGTCTAHAVAGAFAYLQRKHRLHSIVPSRRFIFYNEMAMTGQLNSNCTVHLRDALKAVAAKGVCPESHCKYKDDDRLLHKRPHEKAFRAARNRKLATYHRIPIERHSPPLFLKHLKHCLADGYPFVFGFMTYKSFDERRGKWKDGVMPIPNRKKEAQEGGHAVMAVGYDDARKALIVRNSWGPAWGVNGYFLMPYKLVTDPKITFDFWTLRGVTG